MDTDRIAWDVRRELAAFAHQEPAAVREGLASVVRSLVHRTAGGQLTEHAVAGITEQIVHEVQAYGPLWQLVYNDEVSEIMVNGPDKVFVEVDGRNRPVDLHFRSVEHLRSVIDRLRALDTGHRLDQSKPFADLSMPDGSRINAVLPPVGHGGPHLTIRCYRGVFDSLDDFVDNGTMSASMATVLDAAVRARLNILFSGGTGTGKTTLLEILSRSIRRDDRVVVIEDTLELRLALDNVVRLLTREHNVEGRGQISIGDLFRNALRMAPDRILLGEVRGGEAYDLLQALNSGHRGTLAVIHASSPEEAIVRLLNLVPLAHLDLPTEVVKQQLGHGLDLIVQMSHQPSGGRVLTRITEVQGVNASGEPVVADLFRWDSTTRADGTLDGHHHATGVTPLVFSRLRAAVPDLDRALFARP